MKKYFYFSGKNWIFLKIINGLDLLDNNNKYKDIEYFINSLREKYQGKISLNEFDEYISNVKRLCFKYINWFENKIARP